MDADKQKSSKKRTKPKVDRELFMSSAELEGTPDPEPTESAKTSVESVKTPAPRARVENPLELYYSVDHRKGACDITGSTIVVGAHGAQEAVEMVLAACDTYLQEREAVDVWDVDDEVYHGPGDVFSDEESEDSGHYFGSYAQSCERAAVAQRTPAPPKPPAPEPNNFHLVPVVSSYAHAFVVDDTFDGTQQAKQTQQAAYDAEDAHDPSAQLNVYVALDKQSEYGSLRTVCVAVADSPAHARELLGKVVESADALELLMLRREAEPFVYVTSHARATLPVGDALVPMVSDVLGKRQRSATVTVGGHKQYMDDAQLLSVKNVRQEIKAQ